MILFVFPFPAYWDSLAVGVIPTVFKHKIFSQDKSWMFPRLIWHYTAKGSGIRKCLKQTNKSNQLTKQTKQKQAKTNRQTKDYFHFMFLVALWEGKAEHIKVLGITVIHRSPWDLWMHLYKINGANRNCEYLTFLEN